ncbi:IMPACT family protein [Chromobacterium vaccinii]|uniref:IMPACT family protein n=1 Tax=Chromobacterium vaccinii TaxID=1108595 RepID=UPI000617D3F9|nr:YigZ family protein [Chromobacterium vaccinii]
MFQVQEKAQAEVEIRKSRFIGIVLPVASRDEAMRELAAVRARWPDARHYCAVLLCAGDSMLDDDGEPSGTAAKPMYNVLRHKDIVNVLAVVVRYFGGIKLGAGGLVRAYTQAVNATLAEAVLTPLSRTCLRRLGVDFSGEARLRHACQETGLAVVDQQYADRVWLTVELPEADVDARLAGLADRMAGALEVAGPDR